MYLILDYRIWAKQSSRATGGRRFGEFEVLRARSLGPLGKARSFGIRPGWGPNFLTARRQLLW